MRLFLYTAVFFLLASCATRQPVLYPNNHLQEVGSIQAERDIEECRQYADRLIRTGSTRDVAESTVLGGASGAAIGAAGGAVVGSAGSGAGIGGGSGAMAGLLRGLFRASEPSPLYKAYVDRCLQEKGYQPIGWQ